MPGRRWPRTGLQRETTPFAREVRSQCGPPPILRHVQEVRAVRLNVRMADGVPQQDHTLNRVLNGVRTPLRPGIQEPVLQGPKAILAEREPLFGEVTRPWTAGLKGGVVPRSALGTQRVQGEEVAHRAVDPREEHETLTSCNQVRVFLNGWRAIHTASLDQGGPCRFEV